MRKRGISLVTVLALCLCLLPGTALAAAGEGNWTDGLTEAPAGYTEEADGTTITIASAEGLAWLAVQVRGLNGIAKNDFAEKTVVLAADLDLNGKNWTPIGDGSARYKGNFDGGNHTISNMVIHANNGEQYIGLFGTVWFRGSDENPSYVKDVTLENANIVTGNIGAGAYVGTLIGEAFAGRGSISGCRASGEINCQVATGDIDAGGMIGHVNPIQNVAESIQITNCTANVKVGGKYNQGGGFVGGMSEGAKISNCGATGTVIMDEPYNGYTSAVAGGFLGALMILNETPLSIQDCYATGDVFVNASTGGYQAAGGFLGGEPYAEAPAVIQGCFASGDVTVTTNSKEMQCVGGFIGLGFQKLKMKDSYCTGDVAVTNGTALAGGFAGYNGGELANCYSLGTVTSQSETLARAFGLVANASAGSIYENCYALGAAMTGTVVSPCLSTSAEITNKGCYHYAGIDFGEGTPAGTEQSTALSLEQIISGAFTGLDGEAWMKDPGPLPHLKAIPSEVQVTEKPSYLYRSVTFDAQGGSGVDAQRVYYGTTITAPVSTREGYDLAGWYTTAEGAGEAFNFETPITEDMTLYARWTEKPAPPPSGGGGSNGGGTTPTPPPVSTDTDTSGGAPTTETTAKPSATTQGETATATVNKATADEVVKQATENQSETVVIAPEVKGDVTKTEVSLPAETVGALGSGTQANLTVSTPVAEVTIPNGGLGSLSSGGGKVTVTAEKQGNRVTLSITAGGERVGEIPGGITLTVPHKDCTPGTVAVLVYEDGSREVVRKSIADGDALKVTIPLDGSAKLELLDNGQSFADVPGDHWAAEAVAFASGHELFHGTGAGQFSPDQPMSRGMLAVVLHNLERNPEAAGGSFEDVDDGQWYAQAVTWATEQGIVTGYGGGQFGPDDNITREQLAVILWRYGGQPAAAQNLPFSDADQASPWALTALSWAAEQGILNGKVGGILDPGGFATRGETAQMLMHFMTR